MNSRMQPHVYSEASRYGLHKNRKTTARMAEMEDMYFQPRGSNFPAQKVELEGFREMIEEMTAEFFTIDGITARDDAFPK